MFIVSEGKEKNVIAELTFRKAFEEINSSKNNISSALYKKSGNV